MEQVRTARTEDLGRCRELAALAGSESGCELHLALDGLGDDARDVALGCFAEEIVGVVVSRLEEAEAVIELCYVEPEARGVGVGSALIEHALTWAAGRGARNVAVRALPGDRQSKRLFEAAGFKTRLLTLSRPVASPDAEPPAGP